MLPPQPPTRPTGNHDQTAARRHTAIGTATRAIGVIGARASCVCLLNATARGARRTLHAQHMRRAPRDAEEPPLTRPFRGEVAGLDGGFTTLDAARVLASLVPVVPLEGGDVKLLGVGSR